MNVNLKIREVKENANLKIREVNDRKNRGGNVQKLQLGKNQTQCRFFLLVETSAILVSEVRLTPRARVSSFDSLKSFSSIYEYDE
jgi:hypothetical protein